MNVHSAFHTTENRSGPALSSATDGVFETSHPGQWQAFISKMFTKLRLSSIERSAFSACVSGLSIDALSLAEISAAAQCVQRGKHEISTSNSDCSFLIMQRSGNCLVSMQKYDPVMLRKGDSILIDACAPYFLKFDALAKQPRITIPNDRLRALAPQFENSIAGHKLDKNDLMSRVLADAVQELRDVDASSDDTSELAAYLFYQILADSFTQHTCLNESDNHQRTFAFNIIENYVLHRCDQDKISISDAARDLNISVRSIQRTCSANGWTFKRLVLSCRLRGAAHRLRQLKFLNQTNLTDVAHEFGFSDLPHFTRSFKSIFGVPPSVYAIKYC